MGLGRRVGAHDGDGVSRSSTPTPVLLRRTIEITETIAEVDGRIEIADVKTRSSRRTLAVPPFILDRLAEHLAVRERPGPDEYVFTMPEGGPLRRTTFRRRIWDPQSTRQD